MSFLYCELNCLPPSDTTMHCKNTKNGAGPGNRPGPIREIRGPGENFCFGALFFPKMLASGEGRGVENFFRTLKKVKKIF